MVRKWKQSRGTDTCLPVAGHFRGHIISMDTMVLSVSTILVHAKTACKYTVIGALF